MSISFNGYKNNVITFENGNAALGYPMTVDNDGKASNASKGNDFIGVCTALSGDYASVQTDGYIEMKYVNSPPQFGVYGLVASGDGMVMAADPKEMAKSYTIVKVDTENNIVGFIL
jgi:hypothetical protein